MDSHEQYAYRFATQQVTLTGQARVAVRGLRGVIADGRLVASVERKSLVDLVASLTGRGDCGMPWAKLAALPRAAVVVEDRYSGVFKLDRVRPALVADGLAEVGTTVAERTDRVLRDPAVGRGVDLPVPGRRARLGRH